MTYRVLGKSLWPMADAVSKYLKEHRGLAAIRIEDEISDDVPRPTLHAQTADLAYLCVEVLEDSCFNSNIERFVSKCKTKQLPVRLFVAVPDGARSATFGRDFRAAREQGVGILSVSDAGAVEVLAEPISLVLADVRRIDPSLFPSKYRADLTQAQQTYLNGNPVKGCAAIYDIIESLLRRVAAKLHKKGWVKAWNTKAPKFEKVAWFKLADDIYKTLDFNKVPRQTQPMWARIIALTPLRNEAGHEPRTMRARVARDKELRTRFEDAADVLRVLIEATKDLSV